MLKLSVALIPILLASTAQAQVSSSRPSDAEMLVIYRQFENGALVENRVSAGEDMRACGALGYTAHPQTFQSDLADLWRTINATDPEDFGAFLNRYNVILQRIKAENEAEFVQATTSKAAFEIFKTGMLRRCAALSIDHPMWLESTRSTVGTSVMAWMAIEDELFPPE